MLFTTLLGHCKVISVMTITRAQRVATVHILSSRECRHSNNELLYEKQHHGTSGNTTHGMYFTRGLPKNNIYLFGCTGTSKKVLHQLQSNEQATTPNIIGNSTRAHIYLKDYALNCTDTHLVKTVQRGHFLVHLLTDYIFSSFAFQFIAKYLCLGSYDAEASSTGVVCNLQDDISQAAIYSEKSCHKTGLYNKLKEA